MRRLLAPLLASFLLVGCPHAHPSYDYEGAAPTPAPTVAPSPLQPFPLVLVPTAGLRVYPDLCALVTAGCARWNAALGEPIFLQAGPGRVVFVDLMDAIPTVKGTAVGEVDNLINPRQMHLWPGILPPLAYSIVLHEMGHLLGLAHSLEGDDVMYEMAQFATDLSLNDISRGRKAVADRRRSNAR